jgi:hypothetical protein
VNTIISVVFGNRHEAAGWITEQDVEGLPAVGTPVSINVGAPDSPLSAEGQVFRSWSGIDGDPGGIFIFGGQSVPDAAFQYGMDNASWDRISDEALRVLVETATQTPALAAVHEVTLVIGDPCKPETIQAFQRLLQPYDPVLPLFSQRLRVEAFEDKEWQDLHRQALQDGEAEDEEWLIEVQAIENELLGRATIPAARLGLPGLVIYSSLISNGVARVCFWAPGLGDVDGADLIANSWDPIRVPQQFDPVDFRLERRVQLALRSQVDFVDTEFGTSTVNEWSIDEPLFVDEEDYALLPPLLVEHCKAQKDLSDIDLFLSEWRDQG